MTENRKIASLTPVFMIGRVGNYYLDYVFTRRKPY